ncbi:hypothetical protein EW026_g6024 [Hermanssonia centrifuga]|uniref:Uncharacterized protein n=1 Tax=Hermanssonia centrifuga TaxID=98765 RepID=A0A4S4KCA5_9APHY|nr:hypothetical protein EW026_g6024 [Hermanssonia centrifuga]
MTLTGTASITSLEERYKVFSALRIFAICEHNVPVSLLVLVLNLLPAVADILNSGGKSTAYVEPIEGAFCGYTLWQLPADDPDADWVFRPLSTPILISRFMLNLRQVNTAQNEMQNALDSCSSALTFRVPTLTSFIGNMGEDLYHGAEAGEDIAEESDIEILDDA